MSDIVISSGAKVSFKAIDGDWVELGKTVGPSSLSMTSEPFKPAAYNFRRLTGITLTMTFTIVGESLTYRRRQSFLALACYTRWPYTN